MFRGQLDIVVVEAWIQVEPTAHANGNSGKNEEEEYGLLAAGLSNLKSVQITVEYVISFILIAVEQI